MKTNSHLPELVTDVSTSARRGPRRPAALAAACFLALASAAVAQNQTINGNLTVNGWIGSTGSIDSDANVFTFGTQGGGIGAGFYYFDDAMPGGTNDTLKFSLNRISASWLWQNGTSTQVPAMRLDSGHQLILYQSDGTTAGVTLLPASTALKLGSTATLTGNGAGLLTTSGALSVGGTLTATGTFTAPSAAFASGINGTPIGNTTPSTGTFSALTVNGQITVRSGNIAALIGADSGSTTMTDATMKVGRIGMPHYTNAQLPVALIAASSSSTQNFLTIGGGTASFNAATNIDFNTAGNTTTQTGTRRGGFGPNGYFDVTGNAAIGGGASSTNRLTLSGVLTGGTQMRYQYIGGAVQSDVTSNAWGIQTFIGTAASSFTLANLYHYAAAQDTIGAGSVVTYQTGFFAPSSLIGAANNYGFRGQIPLGTNRYNLYMDGTAQNYLAGATGIGAQPATDSLLNIAGTAPAASGISRGLIVQPTLSSASAGTLAVGANSYVTLSGSTTVPNVTLVRAAGLAAGTASVTEFNAFDVQNSLTGTITNAYGYRGRLTSGTGRYNLYMDGTAANLLAGQTTITNNTASSSSTTGALVVTGGVGVGGDLSVGGIIRSAGSGNLSLAGNVGIGTTTPSNKLTVTGAASGSPLVNVAETTATGYSQMRYTGTGRLFQTGVGNASESIMGVANKYFIHDATANAVRLTINPSGNVGIGTTNPLDRLHIGGSWRPIIMGSNGGSGVYGAHMGFNMTINTEVVPNTVTKLGGTNQKGGAIVTVDYDGHYSLQTYGAGTENASTISYAPQFIFTNAGHLGIGTTNPQARLQIGSLSDGSGETTNHGELLFSKQNTSLAATGGIEWKIAPDNYGAKIDAIAAGGSNLVFGLRNNSASWLEVMRINPLGNVGIGTTSPNEPLEIAGTGRMFLGDGGGASRKGLLFDTVEDGTYVRLHAYDYGTAGSLNLVINPYGGGNVGIGTTTTSHKLTVNGIIRAKEIIVDTGWADYVFDESYRLAPLSEVEAHIKSAKHLPGVPSAAEVAEHGVSMGEMQSKLLSKVEELTLHLIAQEKQIAALQQEVAELKKGGPSL